MNQYQKDQYDDLFDDEVMRECRAHKAEIAAEFPTWEAYRAYQQQQRKHLEAEGWIFASPDDVPAGQGIRK
jgi:hypothetical protein